MCGGCLSQHGRYVVFEGTITTVPLTVMTFLLKGIGGVLIIKLFEIVDFETNSDFSCGARRGGDGGPRAEHVVWPKTVGFYAGRRRSQDSNRDTKPAFSWYFLFVFFDHNGIHLSD